MTDKNKNIPVGQRIRDLVDPALEDERRADIQYKRLNAVFEEAAGFIPSIMERDFSKIFNRAGNRPTETKNELVLEALMSTDEHMAYSPIRKIGLPISTAFTHFAANEVRELPGYIRLHEVAREMDVALKLVGVIADDSMGGQQQAVLIIDGSKSYDSGAIESGSLYPDLPPQKTKFDGRSPQDFRL